MEPIIKVENLSVSYNLGKTSEVRALKETSFEIYPGEYIIIYGPSGCGKSTLLYCIAGLETPTQGKVWVTGKDLSQLVSEEMEYHRRLRMGMIFQTYNLIPTLNVLDNVTLPQIFGEIRKSERKKKAQLLLQRFGIENLIHRFPGELSGGQQQRVAVARSLIYSPTVLLADEPVGNLDSKSAEIIMDLLSEINDKDKKTIILVTHDPYFLHYANRIFYMKDGRITKAIANPEKPISTLLEKKKITELERLARAYPYLTETRLRAKLILNHLLIPYGIEAQQKIEEVIDKYLLIKISQREMLRALDQPPISLYAQTAHDLTEKIINLAKEIELFEEEKYPELTPVEEKAMTLRGFLLDGYSGQLSFEQIKKLEAVLIERLNGKVGKKEIEKMLDLPFKKGGVGLNRRTAKRFTRQIEIILMKK